MSKEYGVDLAIIGGTGLYDLMTLEDSREENPVSPFGPLSAPICRGQWKGKNVAFLPRHGTGHSVLPHQVNFRANVHGIAQMRPRHVIGINAVGSMDPRCGPGSVVLPDQIIDYTFGRETTYYGFLPDVPIYVDFTEPYEPAWRQRISDVGGDRFAATGDLCLGVTQGPRLETAAEVRRLQNDGCQLVGMTSMPEAVLARELGLKYATIGVVSNWGAGYRPDIGEITMDEVLATVDHGMNVVFEIIGDLLK